MPYIKQDRRDEYDGAINELCLLLQEHNYPCGDVTYVMYKIAAYMFENDTRYQTIAEVRAALVGTLSEFDRRLAFPYEDEKIIENGDVDLDLQFNVEIIECFCGQFNCEYHEED